MCTRTEILTATKKKNITVSERAIIVWNELKLIKNAACWIINDAVYLCIVLTSIVCASFALSRRARSRLWKVIFVFCCNLLCVMKSWWMELRLSGDTGKSNCEYSMTLRKARHDIHVNGDAAAINILGQFIASIALGSERNKQKEAWLAFSTIPDSCRSKSLSLFLIFSHIIY